MKFLGYKKTKTDDVRVNFQLIFLAVARQFAMKSNFHSLKFSLQFVYPDIKSPELFEKKILLCL